MKNVQYYVYGALVVGMIALTAIIAGYFIIRSNTPVPVNEDTPSMDHSKVPMGTNMNSTTYKKYAALKGEEYDKAFITNMLMHHENAINMAKIASTNASRDEIKKLAATIVSAQGQEVTDMTNWQKQWNYPASSDHSAKDMEHDDSVYFAGLFDGEGCTMKERA